MIQQIRLTKITLLGGLYVSQCVLPIFIAQAIIYRGVFDHFLNCFDISCLMAFLAVGIIAKNFDFVLKLRDNTDI